MYVLPVVICYVMYKIKVHLGPTISAQSHIGLGNVQGRQKTHNTVN